MVFCVGTTKCYVYTQMNAPANILVGNPFIIITIQALLPGLVVQGLTGYTLL